MLTGELNVFKLAFKTFLNSFIFVPDDVTFISLLSILQEISDAWPIIGRSPITSSTTLSMFQVKRFLNPLSLFMKNSSEDPKFFVLNICNLLISVKIIR